MFIPFRRTCQIWTAGKANVYGERTFELAFKDVGWAPIYLRDNLGSSSVRADSSASKGRSHEAQADFRIVVEKNVTPKKGDRLVLDGHTRLEVIRVHERMDIVGRLHHWELDCGTGQ